MPKRKTTRNAQGSGTIRQRPDGRWEARYTVGRDPGTGKQIQKSVYGGTQKEVRQKLAQAVASIDDGVYIEPSKLTVGDWLDIWTAEYLGGVKPRTVATYKADIKNHIKPALGAVKLSALSAHSIQAFYNRLQRGEGERSGLSPKTIKNVHGVLHKALKQAVILGYIKFNPADGCTLPRIERKEIRPLDEKQISSFMEAVKGHKYEILYLTTLFCGLRQGEVLGLTWDCVDFDKGTLLINKQLQRIRGGGGGYFMAPPKNDKPRLITPAPTVMKLLKSQKARQAEQRLKAGPIWQKEKNLVFSNELGEFLAPQTVYSNFKTMAKQIGAPEARFHDLRHTYAVASLQAGDDVKTVQSNLGHHTAAFTLDIYGHVTEKMKKDSAARMEGFIETVKKL